MSNGRLKATQSWYTLHWRPITRHHVMMPELMDLDTYNAKKNRRSTRSRRRRRTTRRKGRRGRRRRKRRRRRGGRRRQRKP
jgi:hypothetical protein